MITNNGIIYKATNMTNQKVYIGKTIQEFEDRKTKHKTRSKHDDYVFYRAIKKYGWSNFEWEVIDKADNDDELNDKESYWINYYNSYIHAENSNGYNMTLGGDGSVGYKHTEETKVKMSENHADFTGENSVWFGKKHTDDTKSKISESRKGKYSGENNPRYGADVSESTRSKISEKRKSNGASKGEKNPKAKLTREDVLSILELHSTGEYTRKQLAEMFNISKSSLGYIVTGVTWSDVKEEFERGVE